MPAHPTGPPVRGGPWPARPPTYDRGGGQDAFEQAVAKLWEKDFWVNPLTGQRELNADLVLEGGGVRGIGLAGAILVLAEAGYRFPRAAGTSAGAIVAVLVAAVEKAGKDMTVLSEYLHDIDYSQFTHTNSAQHAVKRILGPAAGAWELMLHSGLYSGGYLNTWLGARLAECGVRTWSDLAIGPDDDPGLSLPPECRYRAVVHVSDITRGMLARLPWDYDNYYGLPAGVQEVVAAVRASMSIPFFFVPVQTHTAQAKTKMDDGSVLPWSGGTVTWVDGGMLMNFPVDAFNRTDSESARWPTIGIKLSAQPGAQPPDRPVNGPLQEGLRCLKTMTGEWDRYHIEQFTAQRTIFVPNAGITATQFDLTPAQQQQLFLNGAQAATRFLIRWADAGGVPRSTRHATAA
ncbi:MAG TPA: patatin-like phospholipase family protein [Streptosporangiaceae bacterium]|nr:patatin-like phospholipase family protein [Streptosporangiaceae bacterium]